MNKTDMFRKNDMIIVIVLLLVAAAGLFAFRFFTSKEGKTVRVTIDGELYGEYELGYLGTMDDEPGFDAIAGDNGDGTGNTDSLPMKKKAGSDALRISIPGKVGECILVIDNGEAYMEEADCPNRICVHHSAISHTGEAIICLPNRVVIEID